MPSTLRDVTREFARGDAALEALRAAARAEPFDRQLADDILRLIAEWENSAAPPSARTRNELRARAKQLLPLDAPDKPEPKKTPQESTAAMYGAGLRGQWRP